MTLQSPASEAEAGALGAMLLDQAAAINGLSILRSEDFGHEAHRLIFEAMAKLQQEGRTPDLVTVTDRLRETGNLDSVGGASYLTGLLHATFSAAMLESYAAILHREADKRALETLGLRLVHQTRNGTEPTAAISEARAALDALEHRAASDGPQAVSLEVLLADQMPDPAPIVQGLIWPQTITLLAGATKIGKTQLALQLARAAVSGGPFLGLAVAEPLSVLYIGQEDARWGLRERMRGIDPRFGQPQAAMRLVAAKGVLLEGVEVRRLVTEHRPGLLILDPLRRFHTREEEKAEMAQVIRQVDLLIRDFGCAVLLVHHLRKPPADRKRRPEVADVRGSSVITDQANTIALLAEDADASTFTITIMGNYAQRRTLRLQRVGAVFERRGTHQALTAKEAIEAFANCEPLTNGEAAKVLMRKGLSRAQAYRKVEELQRAGWLQRSADDRLTLNEALLDAGSAVRAGVSFGPGDGR